jgi:DNA primase
MPIYPQEVIVEYISKYITTDYRISSHDDWINIKSVFAGGHRHTMGFSPSRNQVNDFKTGSWTIPQFIAEYQNISEEQANNILMKIFFKLKKGQLKFSAPSQKAIEPVDLTEITLVPPMKDFTPEVVRNKVGSRAFRYLIHREIGPAHIKKFNLKFCDEENCWVCGGTGTVEEETCDNCAGRGKNPYYNYIIIPTYENGKLVYYQGRNLDKESDFRYRNPRIPRLQVVYFYDLLKENDSIYIAEGPFDAMTMINYSATCLMGNRMSDPQILKILKKHPKEIIFVPDYDETPEKREAMNKSLRKNIDRIQYLNSNGVRIGVYRWYKKYKGKDVSEAQVTEVDRDLVKYVDTFKEKALEKLGAS